MRLTSIALAVAMLNGCIYYENTGDGEGGLDDEWGDWNGDGDITDPGQDTDTSDELALSIFIDPDVVEQGQTTIVSVMSELDIDLTAVIDITATGDIVVSAIQPRPSEVVVGLTVGHTADLGGTDLTIAFEDGTTVFVEGVLTVIENSDPGGSGDDPSCP